MIFLCIQLPEKTLLYSIEDGRAATDYFVIDPITGVITVKTRLSADTSSTTDYVVCTRTNETNYKWFNESIELIDINTDKISILAENHCPGHELHPTDCDDHCDNNGQQKLKTFLY